RALGVVHPVAVQQPLLREGRFLRRREIVAGVVALDQVFQDRAGLGQGLALVDQHRGLAQRMHGPQRLRRQHGPGIALVEDHAVRQGQFLQQPEHALGAGVLKVVDGQHRRLLGGRLILACPMLAIRWAALKRKTPEACAPGVPVCYPGQAGASVNYSAWTWSACRPFWPCTTMKETFWPSCSDLKPEPWIERKCTNRSAPLSGVMKPKPLASLNHLTVPV